MNNNFLLESAIKNNKVNIEDDNIVIDELFQLLEARIVRSSYINIKIFTPLNYANVYDVLQSHNSSEEKYFYNKDGQIVRFMLDANKSANIDHKHDKLRKAIFSAR